MKQIKAFMKKEYLEQVRSGKLIIVLIVFGIIGIASPALAKIMPGMLEMMSEELAESGMIINKIEVNALTSWTQYFKNLQIGIIIFILMYVSTLTNEYQKSTLVNVVTKGLKRWKIVISKMSIIMLLWSIGIVISFGITYGYNAYFWDNSIVSNLLFSIICIYILGIWLISIIILASSIFNSSSMVSISLLIGYGLSYILTLFPSIKQFQPAYLFNTNELIMGVINSNEYYLSIFITIILIILNIGISIILFNKKQL